MGRKKKEEIEKKVKIGVSVASGDAVGLGSITQALLSIIWARIIIIAKNRIIFFISLVIF